MDFRIFVEGLGRWIRFVDRELELRQLDTLAHRGYAFPIAIYGSEGCGKSTLLRYFVTMLKDRSDFVALYIDALESKDLSRAVISSHSEVWSVVEFLASTHVGEGLAEYITSLLRKLHEKMSLRGKKLVIVLDDVYRAIGLENVDRYTKLLYEWIEYLHRELNVDSVLFLLTTSEGISKRILSRHTYVHVYMVWSLPREGFEELVQQLSPSIDSDELWRLTGGNPRALIELAQLDWDVEKWLSYLAERRVSSALRVVDRTRLELVLEDPDSDWEVAEKLEELGLMMELSHALVIGRAPEEDRALGVGRRWAWQIPAYREALKRLLS